MVRAETRIPAWWFMFAVLAAFLAVLAGAQPAWARSRSYSIEKVRIDATVETDGTLSIVEDRTYSFDGSFRGVYWKLSKDAAEGPSIAPNVASAGIVQNGVYTPFSYVAGSQEDSADGTYQMTDEGSTEQVKLYSAHKNDDATFRIVYSYPGLAQRYQDIGELYWKFVSDGWDTASNDVVCTVHLPVPQGQSVQPGDNVRAWGHGPLDAQVSFSGNDIVFTVPQVDSGQFAEARILFPESWLSAEKQLSSSQLDTAMRQEKMWAEKANAERSRSRQWLAVTAAVSLGIPAVLSVVALVCLARNRKANKPLFDDKYFRDVPTKDHPAVLASLLHHGEPNEECLSASIMRLTDLGYAKLGFDEQGRTGLFRKKKQDFWLEPVKRPDGTGPADKVDAATYDLLFVSIASLMPGADEDEGGARVRFSAMGKAAEKHPKRYAKAMDAWQGLVKGQCLSQWFDNDIVVGKTVPFACMLGGFALFLVDIVMMVMGISTNATILGLLASFICIQIAVFADHRLVDMSRTGIETAAKLKALERWLLDFTRLKEAVPQDVVLWNRLLVMAVALGVADKVVDQIKVAQPELYDDLVGMPYSPFIWYAAWGGMDARPMAALGRSMQEAHAMSAETLASSMNSSIGGSGGGFSGGGGGGFGGGGGGGAF